MDSIRAKKPHIKLRNGWWLCNGSVGTNPYKAYKSWLKCKKMNKDIWDRFMQSHEADFADLYRD